MILRRQFRTPFSTAGYAISTGCTQLAGVHEILEPNNRHIRQNHSNLYVEKSMILLSKSATRSKILATHPSHPSFPRKVTCIKDGSFFCAPSAILLAGTFRVREVLG